MQNDLEVRVRHDWNILAAFQRPIPEEPRKARCNRCGQEENLADVRLLRACPAGPVLASELAWDGKEGLRLADDGHSNYCWDVTAHLVGLLNDLGQAGEVYVFDLPCHCDTEKKWVVDPTRMPQDRG